MYVRILKSVLEHGGKAMTRSIANLLEPVIGGVVKFSPLISVDHVSDLLALLMKCLNSVPFLPLVEQLRLASTPFRIANSDLMTFDYYAFHNKIYSILLNANVGQDHEMEQCLVVLHQSLLGSQIITSPTRVASFVKLLFTKMFAIENPALTLQFISLIRLLWKKYARVGTKMFDLLDPDTAFLFDADLDHAGASCAWEMSALAHSWHPYVRDGAVLSLDKNAPWTLAEWDWHHGIAFMPHLGTLWKRDKLLAKK